MLRKSHHSLLLFLIGLPPNAVVLWTLKVCLLKMLDWWIIVKLSAGVDLLLVHDVVRVCLVKVKTERSCPGCWRIILLQLLLLSPHGHSLAWFVIKALLLLMIGQSHSAAASLPWAVYAPSLFIVTVITAATTVVCVFVHIERSGYVWLSFLLHALVSLEVLVLAS